MFTNDSERAPVTEQTSAAFYPRENGNGTVDSICLVCFRTVGPAVSELQLSEFEREHVCESRYTPAAPLSQLTVGGCSHGENNLNGSVQGSATGGKHVGKFEWCWPMIIRQ